MEPTLVWNHNLHYHRLVLDRIPPGARTALDVGTGDGLLAADLRERLDDVTAIDADAEVLDRARQLRDDIDGSSAMSSGTSPVDVSTSSRRSRRSTISPVSTRRCSPSPN